MRKCFNQLLFNDIANFFNRTGNIFSNILFKIIILKIQYKTIIQILKQIFSNFFYIYSSFFNYF
jgi:hypothetical protein